jgi:hypothetical protein
MKRIISAASGAMAIAYVVLAQSAPAIAASPSAAFQQGLADRGEWEAWFAGSQGDYHQGALYWSAQRSLAQPGPCATPSMPQAWRDGCGAAQQQLALSDARRRSEPDYKKGWNSWASSATALPVPMSQPAIPAQNDVVPPPRSSQSEPRWAAINSEKYLVDYVDEGSTTVNGNIASIWYMQDYRVILGSDGKEIARGASGYEFNSAKDQVEYDCTSSQYRVIWFGTFSEHMGRGKFVDGGPVRSDDKAGMWHETPPSDQKGREIACGHKRPILSSGSEAYTEIAQSDLNAISQKKTKEYCATAAPLYW